MKMPLIIVLILLVFSCNKKNKDYSLNQLSPQEVSQAIDSIWVKVVAMDTDSSGLAFQERERYASILENYYLSSDSHTAAPQNAHGKALLYTYFIRFRNSDISKISDTFLNRDNNISTELWAAIYPIFYKCMLRKYNNSNAWLEEFELLAQTDGIDSHKIIYWSELGTYFFRQEERTKARDYFLRVTASGPDSEDDVLDNYIKKAQSYLNNMDNLNLGQQAPMFCASNIKDKEICFEPGNEKIYLLDFWATWCGPCIADLPKLKKIFDKYGHRDDFQMLSISLDKDKVSLGKFLQQHDIRWPQIFEGGDEKRKGKITSLYNGFSLPTYYLIDGQGLIHYNLSSREEGLDLEVVLAGLFGE